LSGSDCNVEIHFCGTWASANSNSNPISSGIYTRKNDRGCEWGVVEGDGLGRSQSDSGLPAAAALIGIAMNPPPHPPKFCLDTTTEEGWGEGA
jgi:hypothetical protein